jgi:hypothetical protein
MQPQQMQNDVEHVAQVLSLQSKYFSRYNNVRYENKPVQSSRSKYEGQ